MRRKILIEENETARNGFEDIEITYPFCFKTKQDNYGKINYYRYLEDGRYENITVEYLQMHFSYGNHSNTIYALCGDHEFYFKHLANIHTLIDSKEFEDARQIYFDRYNDYLEGLKYIAKEVKEMIKNSPDSQRKDFLEEKEIIENNNDIISDNDETPF